MELSKYVKQVKVKLQPSAVVNLFLHYALVGKEVKCICCGSEYKTFLPAGIQKRSNARCIKCGSLERHRTLWKYFQDNKMLEGKNIKLLHVAPERIFYKHFMSLKNIEYFPIDLMPNEYAYGIKTIEMDVTNMTYEDNYFDVIICNHVLEHIRADRKAMKEMYRVLKPGGWAILNTPVNFNVEKTVEDVNLYDPKKQLELFGQPDHVRVYGKDFINRLTSSGFATEVFDYAGMYSNNEQFRYGFKRHEEIILCKK